MYRRVLSAAGHDTNEPDVTLQGIGASGYLVRNIVRNCMANGCTISHSATATVEHNLIEDNVDVGLSFSDSGTGTSVCGLLVSIFEQGVV